MGVPFLFVAAADRAARLSGGEPRHRRSHGQNTFVAA
jgi:hypothetical protein